MHKSVELSMGPDFEGPVVILPWCQDPDQVTVRVENWGRKMTGAYCSLGPMLQVLATKDPMADM